jgi:hypothetical protein
MKTTVKHLTFALERAQAFAGGQAEGLRVMAFSRQELPDDAREAYVEAAMTVAKVRHAIQLASQAMVPGYEKATYPTLGYLEAAFKAVEAMLAIYNEEGLEPPRALVRQRNDLHDAVSLGRSMEVDIPVHLDPSLFIR